jgi:D-galactose 1-dehydrogenase
LKIAVVGYGKIAKDQHVPSIDQTSGMELVATVSKRGDAPAGIASFATLDALAESDVAVDAVALCTPPEGRFDLAKQAVDFGWDILLEKPPGTSAVEVLALAQYAQSAGRIIFTTWHSQYNRAVEAAAARLAGQNVTRMRIDWQEDVRKWHPGQDWIWQKGGFGVFDPGINALSIATLIMPVPLAVVTSRLLISENHEEPISVDIDFGGNMSANFDWRFTGSERWQIAVDTETESLLLDQGGSELWVNGELCIASEPREYQDIYARFAGLVAARQSHADVAPLLIVEHCQRSGERIVTDLFKP